MIESTRQLLEEVNPNLGGQLSHFIAGAIGQPLTGGPYSHSQHWALFRVAPCDATNIYLSACLGTPAASSFLGSFIHYFKFHVLVHPRGDQDNYIVFNNLHTRILPICIHVF